MPTSGSVPSTDSKLPPTLGALKAAGSRHAPRGVKEELRANLIAALTAGKTGEELFPGLIGYHETVIPQVVNAVLAGHDLLLLGLRGQAKTRLARALMRFLDARVPALAGDPLRSHPLEPVGAMAQDIVARDGDAARVVWLGHDDRYGEKLATPDVSVADLIGDVDPIRASREGYDLGDLRAVTFGIVPRTNRGIFCINELPDLAPRIQVALFNILEEQDVQVRGIPLRLPLDLMLVFTANPEDYTSRGQIITPLKDRIGAQVLTHYPKTRDEGVRIMAQEAHVAVSAAVTPIVPDLFHQIIEEAARAARTSEFVDTKSGVSARLTIAALEALHANVLQRGLLLKESRPMARLVDLPATLSAMTGKIELAYEGEQEGPLKVGWHVLSEAVKTLWAERLPPVITEKEDEREKGPWKNILAWFAAGNVLTLSDRSTTQEHEAALAAVPDLAKTTDHLLKPPAAERALWQEFVVEGLFHGGALAREDSARGLVYSDLLAHMMGREEKKRRRT
ncbi:MAG: magnesium chelatase [Planctomycetes bacterium]|nr:magnesium chelatase [Planctomycetota bacterium]